MQKQIRDEELIPCIERFIHNWIKSPELSENLLLREREPNEEIPVAAYLYPVESVRFFTYRHIFVRDKRLSMLTLEDLVDLKQVDWGFTVNNVIWSKDKVELVFHNKTPYALYRLETTTNGRNYEKYYLAIDINKKQVEWSFIERYNYWDFFPNGI